MATNSENEYRTSSIELKHTTTPLPKISESPELRPRRDRHRSSKRKRSRSEKLTKDETKYQRFVRDLKKDIQVHMKQCIREDRFDTRDDQSAKADSSIRLLRTVIKSKQTPSTIVPYRTNDTETMTTSLSNRQDPLSFLRYNEEKRLAMDVQRIIDSPEMKTFYTQFIRPVPKEQQIPIPIEESIFNVSEQ